MRWALATIAALLFLGIAVAAAARFFGRPGSRASIFVSVVSAWLGAWVLWSFAGGLLLRYGVLSTYHGPLFAPVALLGALFHYRAHVRAGASRGSRCSWAASSPGSPWSWSRTARSAFDPIV